MEFYDRMHNLPITRNGTLATPYGSHFEGYPYFLIDSNLHPGTSGSPVIIPRGTLRNITEEKQCGDFPPYLLGINSGEYSAGGLNLGLNIVWYSNLIQEIILQ